MIISTSSLFKTPLLEIFSRLAEIKKGQHFMECEKRWCGVPRGNLTPIKLWNFCQFLVNLAKVLEKVEEIRKKNALEL